MNMRNSPVVDDRPLSTSIREATMDAHQAAERTAFVRSLLSGEMPREHYARLIVQHRAIYDVLESAARELRTDPLAGTFSRPELERSSAIIRDLDVLKSNGWVINEDETAATRAYCDRIRAAGKTSASTFIAHHYVRYLGDLSGGQVILKVLRRAYDIDETSGASFYAFPDIPDATAFKQDYRRWLDEAPLSRDERDAMIEEVRVAYRMNAAVFDSLT